MLAAKKSIRLVKKADTPPADSLTPSDTTVDQPTSSPVEPHAAAPSLTSESSTGSTLRKLTVKRSNEVVPVSPASSATVSSVLTANTSTSASSNETTDSKRPKPKKIIITTKEQKPQDAPSESQKTSADSAMNASSQNEKSKLAEMFKPTFIRVVEQKDGAKPVVSVQQSFIRTFENDAATTSPIASLIGTSATPAEPSPKASPQSSPSPQTQTPVASAAASTSDPQADGEGKPARKPRPQRQPRGQGLAANALQAVLNDHSPNGLGEKRPLPEAKQNGNPDIVSEADKRVRVDAVDTAGSATTTDLATSASGLATVIIRNFPPGTTVRAIYEELFPEMGPGSEDTPFIRHIQLFPGTSSMTVELHVPNACAHRIATRLNGVSFYGWRLRAIIGEAVTSTGLAHVPQPPVAISAAVKPEHVATYVPPQPTPQSQTVPQPMAQSTFQPQTQAQTQPQTQPQPQVQPQVSETQPSVPAQSSTTTVSPPAGVTRSPSQTKSIIPTPPWYYMGLTSMRSGRPGELSARWADISLPRPVFPTLPEFNRTDYIAQTLDRVARNAGTTRVENQEIFVKISDKFAVDYTASLAGAAAAAEALAQHQKSTYDQPRSGAPASRSDYRRDDYSGRPDQPRHFRGDSRGGDNRGDYNRGDYGRNDRRDNYRDRDGGRRSFGGATSSNPGGAANRNQGPGDGRQGGMNSGNQYANASYDGNMHTSGGSATSYQPSASTTDYSSQEPTPSPQSSYHADQTTSYAASYGYAAAPPPIPPPAAAAGHVNTTPGMSSWHPPGLTPSIIPKGQHELTAEGESRRASGRFGNRARL